MLAVEVSKMKRLTVITVVAALLAAGVPVIAHTGSGGHEAGDGFDRHEVGEDRSPFFENLTVEEDAYVKAGWWDGFDPTGGDAELGGGRNLSDPTQPEKKEKITWLKLDTESDTDASEYTVEVEADAGAIARLDVFRIYQKNTASISPNCPQQPVTQLYPGQQGEDELGYALRLANQAQWHSAAVGGAGGVDRTSVELDTDHAQKGFVVAVYPAAGSSTASSDGPAKIQTKVSANDGNGVVTEGLESFGQPDQPVATPYVQDPFRLFNCDLPLPSVFADPVVPELPTSNDGAALARGLFGSALE
jgi:hypothetical protein